MGSASLKTPRVMLGCQEEANAVVSAKNNDPE